MPPPLQLVGLRSVDPRIWSACAGTAVQIPALHSRVFYFPQGHLEQASTASSLLSSPAVSRSFVPCLVSDVQFLADRVTDEVYTKLLLVPLLDPSRALTHYLPGNGGIGEEEGDRIASFAKILTPSDANNGGGFSVPRFCADSIFPPLNYLADPPVQNLSVTDVHGNVWEFRHIYRGTPRRHLLTTGWSKFVNNKKLIAGDSVVFMRNSTGKMFIGVRRSVKLGLGGDSARWRETAVCAGVKAESRGTEGFVKGGRGMMTAEAVVEAVERATKGLPFEVVYYPRAGCADFVVRAEAVEAAVKVYWTGGMRVKMAVETEDSSRMTWFQGTVASAFVPDCGPWRGSPWRMLQVTWDEPEVLQTAKRVSPWEVELVPPTPLHSAFPPSKKFKTPIDSRVTGEGEFFSLSGLANPTVGHLNLSLLHYSFPAGMQGARQNQFSSHSLDNYVNENNTTLWSENVTSKCDEPNLKRVSTELNMGSSQSDNLSPDSRSSAHSFVTELCENGGCNPMRSGISSFQLFGKTIHMNVPAESAYDYVGSLEDDGSKGHNESDCLNNSLDLSLSHRYSELLDTLGVQGIEAYSL